MADFDIRGKVALVTGGGTGIGRAVSDGLAEAGATVIIAGRRREVTGSAAAELRAKGMSAEGMQVDVTDVGDIGRLFAGIKERHGKLDILVTSAAPSESRCWIMTRRAGTSLSAPTSRGHSSPRRRQRG